MVAHTFNLSRWISVKFKASLVHRTSSRTVKVTQRKPYLKNQKKRIRVGGREEDLNSSGKMLSLEQRPSALSAL